MEQAEIDRLNKNLEELEIALAEEKFCNEKIRLEFSDILTSEMGIKKSSKPVLEEEDFSFSKRMLLKHQKETNEMKEVIIIEIWLNRKRKSRNSKKLNSVKRYRLEIYKLS